jgi:hypothetical protein
MAAPRARPRAGAADPIRWSTSLTRWHPDRLPAARKRPRRRDRARLDVHVRKPDGTRRASRQELHGLRIRPPGLRCQRAGFRQRKAEGPMSRISTRCFPHRAVPAFSGQRRRDHIPEGRPRIPRGIPRRTIRATSFPQSRRSGESHSAPRQGNGRRQRNRRSCHRDGRAHLGPLVIESLPCGLLEQMTRRMISGGGGDWGDLHVLPRPSPDAPPRGARHRRDERPAAGAGGHQGRGPAVWRLQELAFLKRVLDSIEAVVPRTERVTLRGLNHASPWNSDLRGKPGPIAEQLGQFFGTADPA